jgi:3-oxoadipate enol-lactonase
MTLHVIDRVAVEDEGEGPVIVCLHGLGGSSNTFTPLMTAMARHRVVRIDLPGSGRSQRAEGVLSIDRFVDTVLNICSRLNIVQAHWVGHSLGTIVCQHVAVRASKMVSGLVLFGPLLSPPDAVRSALQARAAKARSEGLQGMHDITQALVQAALSSDTRERLPLAVSFVRESVMRQDAENYAHTCDALATAQAAAIEQIQVPVLLVTGDEDVVAPPQAVRVMANKFHEARNCRVVVLPRCGHWTPIERTEECSRELREYLASSR